MSEVQIACGSKDPRPLPEWPAVPQFCEGIRKWDLGQFRNPVYQRGWLPEPHAEQCQKKPEYEQWNTDGEHVESWRAPFSRPESSDKSIDQRHYEDRDHHGREQIPVDEKINSCEHPIQKCQEPGAYEDAVDESEERGQEIRADQEKEKKVCPMAS